MSTLRARFLFCLVSTLAGVSARAQVEIYSVPLPGQQTRPAPVTMTAKPSAATGTGALQIPLDNTGFADWRFVNPLNPVEVPPNASLEFVNTTADRTFEVSTKLNLGPTLLAERVPPTTTPILIYDVVSASLSLLLPKPPSPAELLDLANGTTRTRVNPLLPDETLQHYEARLLHSLPSNLSSDPHSPLNVESILEGVLELESAIREQVAALKKENAATTALLGLPPTALGVDFTAAKIRRDLDREASRLATQRVVDLTLGEGGSIGKEYLAKIRKPLIDHLKKAQEVISKLRIAEPDREKRKLLQDLDLLWNIALELLASQSAATSASIPLRQSIASLHLTDCTAGATITCSAAVQVYPSGTATLPFDVLLNQADPTNPARFDLKFFEEAESPAKATAYLVAAGMGASPSVPKSSGTISAVASVGFGWDPFINDRSMTSRNCPAFCESKPYKGERRAHYPGSGRVEVVQTFGNLFDGKVSLGFKEGDLGGDSSSLNVKVSQYRFNIYSTRSWTFHYGKFSFAQPSAGIAINETGEGLRLAFRNVALSRVIKREDKSVDEKSNQDAGSFILEAANMLVPGNSPLRTVTLVGVWGNDRKKPVLQSDKRVSSLEPMDLPVMETVHSAHRYWSVGGQLGFTFPRIAYGTLSAYQSKRVAKEKNAPCGEFLHVCDGRGTVGLITITHPFSLDANNKPTRTLTLSLAAGSGDDPKSKDQDEGYIGESPAYAPDQLFLSSFSGAISTRDFVDHSQYAGRAQEFHDLDLGAIGIGRGLANKRYTGLKYIDNSQSFLALIATGLFRIPASDIRSRSTTLTLNDYRLMRALDGSTNAGQELDLEFNVETPRSVKVSLKGAYYRKGPAVERFIHDDAWSVATTISISL